MSGVADKGPGTGEGRNGPTARRRDGETAKQRTSGKTIYPVGRIRTNLSQTSLRQASDKDTTIERIEL
jgi:hypothetical protein